MIGKIYRIIQKRQSNWYKYILYTLLIFSAATGMAAACQQANDVPVPSVADGISDSGFPIVLASLEENQIFLTADPLPEMVYWYSPLSLSINGREHTFDWGNISNPSYYPHMKLVDIDGDGEDELFIQVCVGQGNGCFVGELHVINTEDFSEISVEDPLSVLKERTKTEINKKGIKIQIDDESPVLYSENEVEAKVDKRERWYESPKYGTYISYKEKSNEIHADVGAELTHYAFLGDFTLVYRYEDNGLVVNKIIFKNNELHDLNQLDK